MKNDNDIFHHLDLSELLNAKLQLDQSLKNVNVNSTLKLQHKITRRSTVCLKSTNTTVNFMWVEAQQRHVLSQTKATDSISSNVWSKLSQAQRQVSSPLSEWVCRDLEVSPQKKRYHDARMRGCIFRRREKITLSPSSPRIIIKLESLKISNYVQQLWRRFNVRQL